MKLYLMRHGQAESYAASDAERQLTDRGVAQSRAMAGHLREVPPARVVASPLVRACQTAYNVMEPLESEVPFDMCSLLTPDEDPARVLTWLEQQDLSAGPLMLVTHNPLVTLLTSVLLHGHMQGDIAFGTADMVLLELDAMAPGCARLVWYEQAP